MKDLGVQSELDVHTDSTAARGIAMRKGVGKVRHLEVSYLWIQYKIAAKAMRLHKVLGTQNPADVFTKNVNAELIDRYCQLVNIQFVEGRAASAPEVR